MAQCNGKGGQVKQDKTITRTIYLSYFLNENTPIYGKGNGVDFTPDKQMSKGDTCNTMKLSLLNHCGTHIELPYHFDPAGKTLTDFPPDFWIFNNVDIVDVSDKIKDTQLIEPAMINSLENETR